MKRINEGKRGKALCLLCTDTTGGKGVLWTSGRPRCLVEYGEPVQYGEGAEGSAWSMTRIILLAWQSAHQDIQQV
ncbi:MAG: hypothetical protein QW134_08390 [Nitrososphaeria archaeon]